MAATYNLTDLRAGVFVMRRSKILSVYINLLYLIGVSIFLATCAGEPDPGGAPGNCRLNCAGSKIASKAMNIVWQHDPGVLGRYYCNCNGVEGKAVRSVPLRFWLKNRVRI